MLLPRDLEGDFHAQMDSSASRQGINVMEGSNVVTEVMNIPVYVERIVTLWKEVGLPVQMDSNASRQKTNAMERRGIVMTVVMNIPVFVELIVAL